MGADSALLADRQRVGERFRVAAGTLRENLEEAAATMDRVRARLGRYGS